MAIDLFAAAGNQRLAIYSDSTGPDSLISESASVPCATGFPFVPITPFFNTVVGTQWLAYQVDNGSTNTYRSNGGTRKLHTFTYGAMNNPFGSLDISQSITDHMKIGYS